MKLLAILGGWLIVSYSCKPIENNVDSELSGAETKTTPVDSALIESCPSLLVAPSTKGFAFKLNLPKSWGDVGKKAKENVSANVKHALQLLYNPFDKLQKNPILDANYRLGMLLLHKGGLRNITRFYIGGRDQENIDGLLDFIKENHISCKDVIDVERKFDFDIVGINMNFPNSATERYQSIHFHGQDTDYVVMELTGKRMLIKVSSRNWGNPLSWRTVREGREFRKKLTGRDKQYFDTYEVNENGGIINHDRVIDPDGEGKHIILLRDGALVNN